MERTEVPERFKQHPTKATEPQVKWIMDMIETKEFPDQASEDRLRKMVRIWHDPEEIGITKAKASEIIDWLKERPTKANAQTTGPGEWNDVPAGRYAVDSNEGELRFYQVWRPKDNPKIYRLYVLHGPDSSAVQGKAVRPIMMKIAKDVEAAMIRYGHEIGSCSVCGRRLTNRISRELGIGPVCGGRMWEDFGDKVSAARQNILDRGEDPDEELTTEGWPPVERAYG